MIIEEPNDFSSQEQWGEFLTDLQAIDLTLLDDEDANKVLDAIEKAKSHLT